MHKLIFTPSYIPSNSQSPDGRVIPLNALVVPGGDNAEANASPAFEKLMGLVLSPSTVVATEGAEAGVEALLVTRAGWDWRNMWEVITSFRGLWVVVLLLLLPVLR